MSVTEVVRGVDIEWQAICLQEQVQILTDALRDILIGAQMMQQPMLSADTRRYAAEVQRVAKAAIDESRLAT